MASPVSGDLLSASSLLLAVISMLYAIWYGEIKDAEDVRIERFLEDRGPQLAVVMQVLKFRATPLLAATALLAILLAPPVWEIVFASWHAIRIGGGSYNAIWACFLAVYVLVVVLALSLGGAVFQLLRKRSKILTK